MEVLEQLEERVNALLTGMDSLAAENAELKARLETFSELEEDNRRLRQAVSEERDKNEAALTRVNSILAKLKDLPE